MQVLSKEWKIFHVSLQEESGKENKKVFGLQIQEGVINSWKDVCPLLLQQVDWEREYTTKKVGRKKIL